MVASAATMTGGVLAGFALPRLHRSAPPALGIQLVTGQRGNASFPLRPLWAAAVRVVPRPCRAKSGEARAEGRPKDPKEDMVFVVLSQQAEQAIVLISRARLASEEMEATNNLKKHFRHLAEVASKGEVDKSGGVRDLVKGVYRLINLVYKSFPSTPRFIPPMTEEEFVDFILGYQFPEYFSRGFAFTENLGQYPEAHMDKGYLATIFMSMQLARGVVDGQLGA